MVKAVCHLIGKHDVLVGAFADRDLSLIVNGITDVELEEVIAEFALFLVRLLLVVGRKGVLVLDLYVGRNAVHGDEGTGRRADIVVTGIKVFPYDGICAGFFCADHSEITDLSLEPVDRAGSEVAFGVLTGVLDRDIALIVNGKIVIFRYGPVTLIGNSVLAFNSSVRDSRSEDLVKCVRLALDRVCDCDRAFDVNIGIIGVCGSCRHSAHSHHHDQYCRQHYCQEFPHSFHFRASFL